MFTLTVFEILLFEGRSKLPPSGIQGANGLNTCETNVPFFNGKEAYGMDQCKITHHDLILTVFLLFALMFFKELSVRLLPFCVE